MKRFKAIRYFFWAASLMVGGSLSNSAIATTISYNFTGDVNSLNQFSGVSAISGRPYTGAAIPLTDVDTGLTTLSGLAVSVGDTLNGTISLNSQFTVPAADITTIFSIYLFRATDITFDYTLSIDLFNNGTQVITPSPFVNSVATKGALAFAKVAPVNMSPSLPISFDTVFFNANITNIIDQNQQHVSSFALASGSPSVGYTSYNTVVPLPAAFWLLISGLGGLALSKRAVSSNTKLESVDSSRSSS